MSSSCTCQTIKTTMGAGACESFPPLTHAVGTLRARPLCSELQ